MFRKTIAVGHAVLTVLLGSAALLSQQTPAPPSSSAGLEFPVIMRQNVAAGKTPVGTKVQAKLVVATLVEGVVVPQDAILSGEVTESVAKSATNPSRLAIRMDSAQWKDGSAPIKVYLTAWYYPVATPTNQDLSNDLPDAAHNPKNWNRAVYDPNNPASQPFPGRDRDKDTLPAPPSPASSISKHRVLMKNVESTRNSDGAVTLTSKRFNIKLDKATTYVLAAGDLAAS
ncbi:MAG: hypothetical protein ABR861_13275 [Terriglobales bacterium]|jgi:hypothetical protein